MILVAGSANLDFVVRAPRIPAPGETVLGHDFSTFAGGKGANQAIACARAGGAATQMLLALGDDAFAAPIEASLRDAGVATVIVRVAGLPTGTAFICVSDDAENAITVASGANALLRPDDLPSLAGVSHLLLQLETPLDSVIAYARSARAAGVTVVLNAAPAQALPAALLDSVDVLIVNEGELAAISGVRGDVDAALARVDVPCVIVTLGAAGCRARRDGSLLLQPAFAVRALDTTAAGDTFCGVLVAALSRGAALPRALREASAAAALACTRVGAQASIPAQAEVTAFLAANGGRA
ncbi:MAG: ribokinase [Pseudomonadota bacterium]